MIAVTGEALIDLQFDGDVLRRFPGGGPFNTAVALAHLGVPTSFLGALSRDRFGRLLEQTLQSAGVYTGDVVRSDALTPIALVDSTGAEAAYSFYLSATAHEALAALARRRLRPGVKALHVGTLALATDPPGSTIVELAERASEGCVLVVDPNIRPAVIADRRAYLARLERLTRVAGLMKLSTSDMAWLYPERSVRDGARCLLEQGATCVVVTRGAHGAQAWIDAGTAEVSAVTIQVADTVGAGDAFCAGLLAWLWKAERLSVQALRNLALPELGAALAYASAVAAAQCTRASAWGPTAADVEHLVAARGMSDVKLSEGNSGLTRVR